MSEEYREPLLPKKEDCDKIDAIFDLLESNPRRALELYSQADPKVQQLITVFNTNECVVTKDPNIQIDLIMAYIIAIANDNESAKKWIWKKSNPQTQEKLDEIDRPGTEE